MTSTAERLLGLGGDIAVVTGGASGIGEAIAHHLADLGAKVIIADRNAEGAARVVADIAAKDGQAAFHLMDMGCGDEAMTAAVAALVAAHGAPSILVNNAGIQDREPLLELTAVQWDQVMTINLRGPFLLLRELAKAMIANGVKGRVVNISSLAVSHPMIPGLAGYAAAKSGLCTLSRNAAFELMEHGIRVNAVLPGGVVTPGSSHGSAKRVVGPATTRAAPLGQLYPADIAAAVAFLVSPAASKITGQSLAVDSGWLLT